MTVRDIVVIGASAGGVEALMDLTRQLPKEFPAALFVTVHFPPTVKSVLPDVLSRAGKLPALHPVDGDHIERGKVYVAPPDYHLLLARDATIRLVRGPTENGNRPAIDPLFRSAAVNYGVRVIGVVLTGTLDDGTAGLLAIKRRGGIGVAQDPDDALFPSMPESAIAHGAVQHVVPLRDMGALLMRLVTEEAADMQRDESDQDDAPRENAYSAFDLRAIEDVDAHPGRPSGYGCPDCGGVLWQIEDGETRRFRCRVGHGWTQDALLLQQTETVDAALWTALRALEENANLHRQLSMRMARRGTTQMAERHAHNAEVAERRAEVLRDALAREVGGNATTKGPNAGDPVAIAARIPRAKGA